MFRFLLRRYASYWLTLGALATALVVKYLLANASVKALDFLLGPPAKIVALCFSASYYWEAEQGYVFPELGMYINKGCAAINFLVILFLALSTLVAFYTSGKQRIKGLLLVLLLSYPLCVATNTLRILLSVQLQEFTHTLSLSLQETIHEFTGACCFFSALLLLMLAAEKLVRLKASPTASLTSFQN